MITLVEVEMSTPYVERKDDTYMVAGTRVSLDSVVYAFAAGQSAESIAQAFPVLTLEQVYGAITFYLAHEEVERYLDGRHRDFEQRQSAARSADPMFYQKLADAKKQSPVVR
jgi:uncharacterized protein (DUF433 family)